MLGIVIRSRVPVVLLGISSTKEEEMYPQFHVSVRFGLMDELMLYS